MTTSVPSISFTPQGFVAPTEQAILAGVASDFNAAFGGNLNPALNTPQGQLATSLTAIIGASNDMQLALFNGVDPAYAWGQLQDAIARIYFLSRNPAQSTSVIATCIGLQGTIIPQFATAIATDGNTYYCVSGGTIPVGGSLALTFACSLTGPIACPAATLTSIYQAIPGWDGIINPADGIVGNDVETRVAFELRRQQSVAANSVGPLAAIRGSVLAVPNVLDVVTAENYTSSPIAVTATANFTAAISTTVMTVSAIPVGAIYVGMAVSGAGVTPGTVIASLGTGAGGTGTYNVNHSQTVGSENLQGGFSLVPNSICVSVAGGNSTAVATAIWKKKAPGCNYNGNTTVTVYDTSPPYTPPGIAYSVTYLTPADVPVYFTVNIANNPGVPANANTLIQSAILAAFAGTDGGPRVHIGSTILASRFYGGITSLGAWAQLLSVTIGAVAPLLAVTSYTGVISTTNLTASAVTGTIIVNQLVTGTGVPSNTRILSQTSGTTGGAGVYVISNSLTISSEAMVGYDTTLTSATVDISQIPVTSANNITVNLI